MNETMEEEAKNKSLNPYLIGGIGLFLIVAVAGFLIFKNSSTDKDDIVSEVSTASSEATPKALPNETGATRTIDISAGSFYYDPKVINVKLGEKVKIVMTAKDMMHDFNIDELGVSIPVTRSGNTNSVEFTASKAGEFEYYCSVGDHRANGQVGKLIVEE